MSYIDQPIIVGNTQDFTLYAKKDGVVWDITGATVLLSLRKPDGTILGPFTAIISNGPGGIAHYQVDNTVLDIEGDWSREWKVSKSGVEIRTKIINFTVEPSLA